MLTALLPLFVAAVVVDSADCLPSVIRTVEPSCVVAVRVPCAMVVVSGRRNVSPLRVVVREDDVKKLSASLRVMLLPLPLIVPSDLR